ncbi:MAG: signal peptidase I [Paracoccaceae bacterium]
MSDKSGSGIVEIVKTVIYALLIAGVFRTLFFQPFYIPSGSMKDTLLIGDFLFVNKMAYGYSKYSCPWALCPIPGRILGSDPKRGDVIVFRHPSNGQDFIKRLIGLPGDTVQVKQGLLYINGAPVKVDPAGVFEEPYEPQGSSGTPPSCKTRTGDICQSDRYTETLPEGVSHDILDIRMQATDNTPVFAVPEGQYFFMGDNRDNSQDSRIPLDQGGVGFVPKDFLIGRAEIIVFSSGGWSLFFFWKWRPDRFFEWVG